MNEDFQGQPIREEKRRSKIKFGKKIIVKISSADLSFSEPVKKIIQDPITKITFIGKPHDDCEPGFLHNIKVSVLDAKTEEEFEYLMLNNVRVVDFAFDHVSRPLLSRVSAVVLGVGSFAMFILTFLEQIDKTVGLTSGTAAGVLALGI
jgi:hypothetical protein